MRLSAPVAAAVLALVLSGCGGDDGPDGPPEPTPLSRRDAPPQGVAELVSYYELGDGGCPAEAGQPTVRFAYGYPREDETEIGRLFVICPLGFAKGLPVEVVVQRPDGREVARRVPRPRRGNVHMLSWDPAPGDPLGRYGVTARQGAMTAGANFYVRRSSVPRLRVDGDFVQPGDAVHVFLAGFAARETVLLHLYRARGEQGNYSYLTSVAAQTDERGEVVKELPSDRRDAPGGYLVRVRKGIEDSFHLGAPPP